MCQTACPIVSSSAYFIHPTGVIGLCPLNPLTVSLHLIMSTPISFIDLARPTVVLLLPIVVHHLHTTQVWAETMLGLSISIASWLPTRLYIYECCCMMLSPPFNRR